MKKNERRRDVNRNDGAFSRTENRRQIVENQDETSDNATRRFRSFFEFGLAATTVAALFCAPEGAIREGDFLPVAFCQLAFAVAAFFFAFRLKERSKSQPVETKRFASLEKLADFALLAFLCWTLFSFGKLVACESGEVRRATNALWTFATPTLLYFFVRYFKTFFSKRLTTNVLVLLIACAAVESAYSSYSYLVANPRLRAEYRADPDGVLRQNGMSFAADSRERLLFEKRLLDSTEPTGTFALANTLAGLLAPALVLALVLSFGSNDFFRRKENETRQRFRPRDVATRCVAGAAILTTAFVLLATKSRAGLLAAVFGLGVWRVAAIVSAFRSNRATARKIALAVCGAAAFGVVCVGAAAATGVIDREVFAEAGKSLGYRLDYWRASTAIVRDFPFFGIGPGEFQNVYPRYVAPTASEFVADPHNFAFELAALFGLPALAAFCVFLGAIFASAFRRKSRLQVIENQCVDDGSNKAFFAGALFGIPLAFCCSVFQTAPLDGTFVAFAFVVLVPTAPSFFALANNVDSRIKIIAAGSALAALALDLCAAGGIGYPAISVPLFLIAASIANNQEQTVCKRIVSKTNGRALAALAVATSIFVVFYSTGFRPRSADFLFSIRVATPDGAALYREAFATGAPEKIDARSVEVVAQCYYFAAQEYFLKPTPANRERWNSLRKKTLDVSPNSATSRENCGDFDFARFERDRTRREFLDSARDFYRGAVERSPTETEKRAKFVRALRASGELAEATIQAKKALELDAGTPHLDRKLTSKSRDELTRFVRGADDGAVAP